VVFVLGGLGQLRSDVEFLTLKICQARCVPGLELHREQILHYEHAVGLHTRDAARARPLIMQLRRTTLAVFHDKHVVSHFEVRRLHMHLVVVFPISSFAITRSFLCHLCVDLRHSL
jgi:hypothetical protein